MTVRVITTVLAMAVCSSVAACDWVFALNHLDGDAATPDAVSPDAPPLPGSWAQVAVGDGFTCAITTTGSLYCWGANGDGQLGLGRGDAELLEPNLTGAAQWTSIAAGIDHACGIQIDGTLWCWGANDGAQLGTNDVAGVNAPVQIFGGGTWSEVATNARFTCAIKSDHTMWCWGNNVNGELGVGDNADHPAPMKVGTAATWLHVATGLHHTCALAMDRRLFCWGANYVGEYGNSTTTTNTVPTQIGVATWTAITAGDSLTCGIETGGRPSCWGSDLDGALGDGASLTELEHDALSPEPVATSAVDWTTVVAGAQTVCGLEATGAMACWGDSAPVALAAPSTKPIAVPDPNPGQGWLSVAVGRTHSCAIADDHNLYCVGDHSAASPTPLKVPGSFNAVAAGSRSTCALEGSTLACWGANERAQLGDGTWNRRLAPTTITGSGWTGAALGGTHTCAIDAQQAVWCWGTEHDATLGDGATFSSSRPIRVPGLTADRIIAKGEVTWTLLGTSPSRWGYNASGQLGTVDLTNRTSPLLSSVQYTDIAVGEQHTCAVLMSGQIQCAGLDDEYELGNNGTNSTSSFGGTSDVTTFYKHVYAGTFHTCGLDTSGHAHCWGRGSFGELGSGVAQTGKVPLVTEPTLSFTQLALGDHHTCGLDQAGEVFCWGRNHRGQLGNGTTANTAAPGAAIPNLTAIAITAGYDFTCALDVSHALYCWGDNRDGQLGTGTGWSSSYFLVPSP